MYNFVDFCLLSSHCLFILCHIFLSVSLFYNFSMFNIASLLSFLVELSILDYIFHISISYIFILDASILHILSNMLVYLFLFSLYNFQCTCLPNKSRLVEIKGVEPLTSCLQGRRSSQLSYIPRY